MELQMLQQEAGMEISNMFHAASLNTYPMIINGRNAMAFLKGILIKIKISYLPITIIICAWEVGKALLLNAAVI
jgi:hypothetical protein